MAKKNRIRLREFVIRSDVLGDLDFEAIMSDILPDDDWELCAVGCTINTKVGAGTVAYVALGKNVYPQEAEALAEKLQTKSGVILHWEPTLWSAVDVSSMHSQFFNFEKPIEFDESDKLNIYMRNSAAKITTFVLTLHYRII